MALEQRILNAVRNGQRITAIGGTVYDYNMRYLCSTSDLANVARKLHLVRVDAGGRPTWERKT